jgi:uncharacterized protein (DUF2062 family)
MCLFGNLRHLFAFGYFFSPQPCVYFLCISLEVLWSMTMIPMRVGGVPAAVVGAGDANVEAGILGFIIRGALMC